MENTPREFEKNMSLEKNEAMDCFVQWMYSHVRPHVGKTVVEAGAGIGTYSYQSYLDGKEVYAVEFSDEYVQLLQKKYQQHPKYHFIQGDITDPALVETLKGKGVDSLFSLNVLEHLVDDQQTLKNFYDILPVGGTAVILVPAHQWLFNTLDTAVGHHRRYAKKEFKDKIEKAGFAIKHLYYFNAPAILGWYVNGNILHKAKVEPGATRAFNHIVPIARWIEEHLFRGTIGISLIAVAQKPEQ